MPWIGRFVQTSDFDLLSVPLWRSTTTKCKSFLWTRIVQNLLPKPLLTIHILPQGSCQVIMFSKLYFLSDTYATPTRIIWIPDNKGIYPDLLATSGDYLRVWRAGDTEIKLECLLNNNKNSDFCAPLTSFDWNEVDPNLIGTSSIGEHTKLFVPYMLHVLKINKCN